MWHKSPWLAAGSNYICRNRQELKTFSWNYCYSHSTSSWLVSRCGDTIKLNEPFQLSSVASGAGHWAQHPRCTVDQARTGSNGLHQHRRQCFAPCPQTRFRPGYRSTLSPDSPTVGQRLLDSFGDITYSSTSCTKHHKGCIVHSVSGHWNHKFTREKT